METMEMINGLTRRVEELAQLVEKKSGNKNPDYYKTLKEYRMLKVIVGLIDNNIGIDQDTQSWLEEYSQGSASGNKIVIEVKEGDNVLELMDKYESVKDVWNRIKDAVAKAGLRIEGSVIVK